MDAGRLFVVKAEMQNAMDACALAAAAQIGAPTAAQLAIAEAHGKRVGSLNKANFQGTSIAEADITVLFSSAATPDSGFVTRDAVANPATVVWTQCRANRNNLNSFLVKVIDIVSDTKAIASKSTGASAVATLAPGTTACALPLAVCRGESGVADSCYHPTAPFNLTKGCWLQGAEDPGGATTSGRYKWVQFPGATTTKTMEQLISGAGVCNLGSVGTVTAAGGQISTFRDAWNGRFGVAQGGKGVTGQLDYSGYAYTNAKSQGKKGTPNWPSGSDAFADFVTKRGTNTPWNGINPDQTGKAWSAATTTQHKAGGDRRLVTVPVINCPISAGANPVLGFACVMMLNPELNPNGYVNLEYRGTAGDPTSGCATSGFAGPGGATRVPALVR